MRKNIFNGNHQHRGAAALEFALIFPVLFLMLYGMISYAIIFAAQSSLSASAAEGARAAVRYMTANDSKSDRETAACNQANIGVAWIKKFGFNNENSVQCLPKFSASCGVPINSSAECFSISLVFSGKLLPAVIIPTPDTLTGSAVAQISRSY